MHYSDAVLFFTRPRTVAVIALFAALLLFTAAATFLINDVSVAPASPNTVIVDLTKQGLAPAASLGGFAFAFFLAALYAFHVDATVYRRGGKYPVRSEWEARIILNMTPDEERRYRRILVGPWIGWVAMLAMLVTPAAMLGVTEHSFPVWLSLIVPLLVTMAAFRGTRERVIAFLSTTHYARNNDISPAELTKPVWMALFANRHYRCVWNGATAEPDPFANPG